MSPTEPQHWTQVPHAPSPGAPVCALADLVDGVATMRTLGVAAMPFHLLLLRSGEVVYGYVNRCAHFGVPLAKQQEQLIFKPHESVSCNVHYARYRWQDGVCVAGECTGAALLAVPLCVQDGVVLVG
ncbi:Rieske (2Fe-2S) protein [Chitinimonas sp. JJ19]|uniref:Rieske (2Fe-2S) protein n=1 Tax=Chitinimonas sp. JJ19 TaxID=3109352 RepID=UPI001A4E26D6|nr:Rieske 2Fe-2S domain-containing protein [Chitinimonas sp.]